MKKIGLTGGIGVGKTFIANVFKQLRVPVFDADIEARKQMALDPDLIKNIKLIFGDEIYIDGLLQKEVLANLIFSDSKKLQELNALVHPAVKQSFLGWCTKQEVNIVVKEAAILFESNSHIGLDKVICVSADEKTRVSRVMLRDNITAAEVRKRINSQMNQAEKERLSDYIVLNNGKELLLPQITKILTQIS